MNETPPVAPLEGATAWLTAALPGIGGILREKPEDFVVEEIARRAPSGKGEFARALIEKHGISTPELQRRIGSALGIAATEVGVAGMKDAVAVARQWISVPWKHEPKLSAATIKMVKILEIAHDHAALHPGELTGNRFVITIRGVGDETAAHARAQAIVDVLARRGVPNFFGPQRFGVRGEAPEIGRRLLARDPIGALDLFLGAPSPLEGDPRAQAFRRAYQKKNYGEALSLVPGRLNGERRLLEQLARGRRKETVAGDLAPATRRMALSAWQAQLFNRVLAQRLQEIDLAVAGDWLLPEAASPAATASAATAPADRPGEELPRQESRRCVDPATDQPEVTAGRLHPTGPLFGERVDLADGRPGEIERAVLAAESIPPDRLRRPAGLALWGERRELRFAPRDVKVTALAGECSLRFEFTLPPGCFATAVLAEVMKDVVPVV